MNVRQVRSASVNPGEHSTFNLQRRTSKTSEGGAHWKLNVECWALNAFRFNPSSFCRVIAVLCAFVGVLPAWAQFDGPGSPGVSASLIRLFGTNFAFTAQMEAQVLGKDNQERIGTPMNFARLGNRIRVDVDMTRMRNREQPDAVAKLKPLGLDQVVSVIRPDLRATCVMFPKLQSVVKLPMPPEEAEAFSKPAKMERTVIAREKMEGYACVKYRVVATDEKGKKHEATAWNATELRDFPLCVMTREGEDTVVVRFRQVQFVSPDAAKFEPPAGYTACADMQALMAGPVVKFMKANKTATTVPKPTATPTTKPKPAASPTTKKK